MDVEGEFKIPFNISGGIETWVGGPQKSGKIHGKMGHLRHSSLETTPSPSKPARVGGLTISVQGCLGGARPGASSLLLGYFQEIFLLLLKTLT